jgi:hypothetical protein
VPMMYALETTLNTFYDLTQPILNVGWIDPDLVVIQ